MKNKDLVNVENVVASADLGQNLDLYLIAKTFHRVEYNPERFPGLIFRLKRPKAVLLIFGSGKMICTGARSERQAKNAVSKTLEEFGRSGITLSKRPKINIENVVASADLKCRVDLEDLALVLKRTVYEPDQFPGLIYSMENPKVVMLIFSSGKLICTGANSENDLVKAVEKLKGIIESKPIVT
ncbi:MAG: TATA-box-binding protein [Candidatus Bathyarchaeia archaeon]